MREKLAGSFSSRHISFPQHGGTLAMFPQLLLLVTIQPNNSTFWPPKWTQEKNSTRVCLSSPRTPTSTSPDLMGTFTTLTFDRVLASNDKRVGCAQCENLLYTKAKGVLIGYWDKVGGRFYNLAEYISFFECMEKLCYSQRGILWLLINSVLVTMKVTKQFSLHRLLWNDSDQTHIVKPALNSVGGTWVAWRPLQEESGRSRAAVAETLVKIIYVHRCNQNPDILDTSNVGHWEATQDT